LSTKEPRTIRRTPLTDVARAYLYCMEQEFGTGTVVTVDGGTTLV
jgi:hypothetical protein